MRGRVLLGSLALLMLMPVTMPVPVLRGLVLERFEVSEVLTSLFMSINMIGAVVCAPLAGAFADRIGRRKTGIVAALVVDAGCLWAMTLQVPFGVFLSIRFVEGCSHILALSLLLSHAADAAPPGRRGRTMGVVGACLTLGVAAGAPLGGALGESDPLFPLQVGSWILIAAAVLTAVALRDLPRAPSQRGEPRSLPGILRRVLADRDLAVPLAFAFADRFTVGFFTTTFPLYMKGVFNLTAPDIGFLLALFLGPFSVLSYFCGRLSERVSRTLLVAGGSVLYGLLLVTLGAWSLDALPYVMLGLGVLSAVMFVPSLLMVSDLTPAAGRSTAMGGFNAAGSLGFILGPLTGGFVSQGVATGWGWGWGAGYAMAFCVAGLAQLACVLVTVRRMRALVREGRLT